MRNDYRRALILLRSSAPGYSGHVRLERRTLMGSMYFLVQLPSDCTSLQAALVGSDRTGYFACALGEIRQDGRGQAVLGYSFDPRNVCGRELEKYQLIVLNRAGTDQVVLYGNVNGHAELNWEQVRAALRALWDVDAAPRTEAPQAVAPPVGGLRDAEAQPTDTEVPEEESAEPAQDAPEEAQAAEDAGEAIPPQADTAGRLLGIDMRLPWAQGAENLRALFQKEAPMENPPDDEYVYVSAPMPRESGFDFCAVGVRVENGAPVFVRYALPAAWTDAPPAGLEDYRWMGDQNRGWWVTEVMV